MYCNKKQTYHWLASNNAVLMTPKPSIHKQKVLLCKWWTAAGIVHYELLPSGQAITAEIYSAQLDRVSDALHQKQEALANIKGAVFHQDNARPHTAKISRETLARLQWEILTHPPYSPDLAPSDYHLFLALDNHMRNQQFQKREDLENELIQFFSYQTQDFYKNGIYQLVSRWKKVILAEGDYLSE
ncbi:histone-lysine N-methyltransferase SETMAR-like [Hydra vulgaris]|uniref:Histone-lysine N-methyltransferase SETMAR-like n=1 Tax=Hydra vulgaris TaxID=6087 RepID=A0ABM4CRG5_HYDVU